jgi:hypothetical protein
MQLLFEYSRVGCLLLLITKIIGSVNALMTNPIWVVNTRMKLHPGGIVSSARGIYEREGWKGFYNGLVPSLILVSNPAIQFAAYEQMVRIMTNRLRRSLPPGSPVQLVIYIYFDI